MAKSSSNKGQELIEQIVIFLKEKGFAPELLKTKSACKLFYTYNTVQYTCYIIIKYDLSMAVFHVIPPLIVKKKKRLPIAEFITRINYGSIFGNFEMDFSDGEVRHTTIETWQKKPIQMDEISDALDTGVSVWGIYLPIFESILYEGTSPKKAFGWL